MMRIHDYDWKKFAIRGGHGGGQHGLFAELGLFCPCCEIKNIVQTTGFEIGKNQPIEVAAQKIVQEIVSGKYRREKCGISSAITPEKHRDYKLGHLMS